MAEATTSLSPNIDLWAVMALARLSATKAVKRELQAQGVRLHYISSKEMRELADTYLAQHRADLIAQAAEIVATSPRFARWRRAKLSINAQTAKPCSSSTISVQKLGAKWRANQ